jgi:flagellar protein FliJ
MPKYRYPFQKIVDLKKSEKTQAEWMLSAAIGKLQAEEQSLEQLTADRLAWLEHLQTAASGGAPLSELQMVQSYVDYLETAIARKQQDVELAMAEVTRKQSALSDTMKDEKVWLKAKEKSLQKFMHTALVKEQNELDEMATVRFLLPSQG